ncbi:MAG: holo-acyl-carrier protein synthase [Spirochaetes bacterium]|nr:MAG: holo-acyl-carrier protein synthase [Spirochaetota bacterium]
MISGIGIDIVHVDRIFRWLEIPGLVDRFFHPQEITAASRRGAGRALSLAARFAAKEAFGKALGTGLAGMQLKDIQVKNDHNGKPCIILERTALEKFHSLGGGTIHCSLTHEGENAVAMVLIEKARDE